MVSARRAMRPIVAIYPGCEVPVIGASPVAVTTRVVSDLLGRLRTLYRDASASRSRADRTPERPACASLSGKRRAAGPAVTKKHDAQPASRERSGSAQVAADMRPGRHAARGRPLHLCSTRRSTSRTRTRTSRPRPRSSTTATARTELGTLRDPEPESIPLEEMPQTHQDAVVAAENRTFWTDKGIDPKGILRAAFSNAQGNAHPGRVDDHPAVRQDPLPHPGAHLTRKLKEAFLSLKIQRQLSKERDPRGLPQHHLLRPRCLRHPGGREGVLRQGGQGPDAARERGARHAC